VYLEEPFVRSTNWVIDPRQDVTRTQFDVVDEVAPHPKGYVPHLLPGSPEAEAKKIEFANRKSLPRDAIRGGAATTRPEWRAGTDAGAAVVRAFRPADYMGPPVMLHVQGNVWMLVGAGGNITVQIGDEGVLLVDTGRRGTTEDVLKAIRTVTDKPIRIIVNTSVGADHTGGNEPLARIGRWLGGNAPGNFGLTVPGARVIAHERALFRMKDLPIGAQPTETFTTDKELFFNGEAIQLIHVPAATTDSSLIVFFRRSDVVSSGDVFTTTAYPVVDRERGGSVQGVIDALNRIIDITIPKDHEEGGTYVVPGHGRLCDEADVVEYRDMLTIIRDRVRAHVSRPSLDYDGRYGTADALIESIR
jgi:glyoxylase-like metal-dependent hydrolase (beta-lactamase superfamily II)